MIPLIFVLALLPAQDTQATENVWPGEGESIYVSASFKGLQGQQPVAGANMKYDMPACKVLVVTKANQKKLRWVTKDLVGGSETLKGNWAVRMHKNEAACKDQYDRLGEPEVHRSGATFKLASESSTNKSAPGKD